LDEEVFLGWTNPGDTDFAGTLVRYSTSAFPDTITDGMPVENGENGVFHNTPGSADQFSHTGLTNNTVYYYTAWTFDASMNYAKGVRDSATPFDGVPPGQAVFQIPSPGDESITLRWTNPSDLDFDHTLIVYSLTDYPAGPTDGTPVENSNAGEFPNDPATVESFVHTGLTNSTTYYYACFAGDEVPNYAAGTTVSETPQDTQPPEALVSFTASARADGSVRLRWEAPDDADFGGTLIRYSTASYPTSATEGTAVENGAEGRFAAEADSFSHTGLTLGTTYYYAAFAYDEVPNYSSALTASATPEDVTDPVLAVSVFQNPYLTNHLDLYLVASEALVGTSIQCTVAGEEVEMELVDEDEHIWRGEYDIYTTGGLSIDVEGCDAALNCADTSRTFSSTLIMASAGGVAASVDAACVVSIPGGAIAQDAYILIFEASADNPGLEHVYEISPGGLGIDGFIEIAITYEDGLEEPEHLTIARIEAAGTVPVESYLDAETGRVVAYVEQLGSYGLLWRSDSITPRYGDRDVVVMQNTPNPFAGATTISFEVSKAGRVRADVISIDGRLIGDLCNRYVVPGRHTIAWDGRDASGERVACGVYFYRVSFDSKTVTRKMVHLR
jgi:hypothetical protein